VIDETIIALTMLTLFLNPILRMIITPKLIAVNTKGVKQEMKILKIKSLSAKKFKFVS